MIFSNILFNSGNYLPQVCPTVVQSLLVTVQHYASFWWHFSLNSNAPIQLKQWLVTNNYYRLYIFAPLLVQYLCRPLVCLKAIKRSSFIHVHCICSLMTNLDHKANCTQCQTKWRSNVQTKAGHICGRQLQRMLEDSVIYSMIMSH